MRVPRPFETVFVLSECHQVDRPERQMGWLGNSPPVSSFEPHGSSDSRKVGLGESARCVTSKSSVFIRGNHSAMQAIRRSLIVFGLFFVPSQVNATPPDRTVLALEHLAQNGSTRAQFELARRYEG